MPHPHWPAGLPEHLELPQTSLSYNLEVSARRYPERTAIHYYGGRMSYAQLAAEVAALAGWLQQRAGVQRGERVLLYLQNSPQFVIAYYAALRVGAMVVPVNPMNLQEEVRHIAADSGARVAIFGQELMRGIAGLLGELIPHALVACYRDYIDPDTDLPLPDTVSAAAITVEAAMPWSEALAAQLTATPDACGPDDLAVMPYTSGTTGAPKGCLQTHRSVMHTAIAGPEWTFAPKDVVVLGALPLFHVTGMQNGMNTPIFRGNTMVLMTRWDRRCAALLIARHRVNAWTAIPTMLFDFLAQPGLDALDVSSLSLLSGGGAAMPKAVAERIHALWGIDYIEGYGLSETMAPTHLNPVHRPKAQCLGLPIFDTTAWVVDPETLQRLPAGEVGELVVDGPQLFQGYHGQPQATQAAFVEIDGRRMFRTGDLARIDEDGYFFMVDRLKRMINASGFKVWPAEVENLLFGHPGIQEACVIGSRDPHRGETVKAFVVAKAGTVLVPDEVSAWAREHMAAYKVPQVVEVVESLPKSATGKVQWRALQERELGQTS